MRHLCEAEKDQMIAGEEQRGHGGFGVLLLRFRRHHIYKLKGSSSTQRDKKGEDERQDGLMVTLVK